VRTILIILGFPGAGKGTQARRIEKWLSVPHVSTGDILRTKMVSAAAQMNTGVLLSDDLVNRLVIARLSENDCMRGFILDGYPRNVKQAKYLGQQFKADDSVRILEIVAEEDQLLTRLLARQRADDREDVIRRRFAIYRQEMQPVIEHLSRFGSFARIDGTATVDEVADAIRETLSPISSAA
jgi:adenylate kinase